MDSTAQDHGTQAQHRPCEHAGREDAPGTAEGAGGLVTPGSTGPRRKYLGLDGGVRASGLSAQERLAVHFRFQTGDVATAEVFAELVHLLQLEKVDPQHLDRFHHLEAETKAQRRTRQHEARAPSAARSCA